MRRGLFMTVVLIVDDDPLQGDILRLILSDEGYHACVATSGEEALKYAKRLEPDVILTDLWLGDMDGVELMKVLKSLSYSRKVIIRNLRYPVSYIVPAMLIIISLSEPGRMLRLFSAIGLMSFLNVLYYLRSEKSWDFVYGIVYSYFAFFTLFWIFPYALLTLRSRSWMTR
jgi:CheY-like chemotaxis protein